MIAPRTALVAALMLALPPVGAAAEGIDIGGEARMGLAGGTTPGGDHRTRLIHDLDLTLRLSRTTDGGLTIGFQFDLDEFLTGAGEPPPGRTRVFDE
jgi:hypothetical protein